MYMPFFAIQNFVFTHLVECVLVDESCHGHPTEVNRLRSLGSILAFFHQLTINKPFRSCEQLFIQKSNSPFLDIGRNKFTCYFICLFYSDRIAVNSCYDF